MADGFESLDQIRQRIVRERLEESGWFAHGLDTLDRLRKAGFKDDQLCWYLPARVLGADSLTGSRLVGLPVHEANSSTPPGIGLVLPTCSKQRECPAHTEPPREVMHLWIPWAKQHRVKVPR